MAHVNDGIVQCDHCALKGMRRPTDIAPDFWFYCETVNRTYGPDSEIYYVAYACSAACRDALWKPAQAGRGTIDEEATLEMRQLATAPTSDESVH